MAGNATKTKKGTGKKPAKAAKPANRQKTGNARRGGKTSTSWRPGQSGNPHGRPAEGESYAAIFKRIGNMDGPSVAAICGPLADKLAVYPRGVPLKELVAMSAFASIIFDPTAGMLNAVVDRVEGKPLQPTADLTKLLAAELERRGLTPAQAVRADPILANLFALVGMPVDVSADVDTAEIVE